jgi:hypothetical protein
LFQNQQVSFVLAMSLQAPGRTATWTDQVFVKPGTGDRRQVILEIYPAKLYDWRTSPSSGFQFCVALEKKKVAIWSKVSLLFFCS